jgi:hypothetical protein
MSAGEPPSTTAVAPAPPADARKTDVKVRYQQVVPIQTLSVMQQDVNNLQLALQYRDERDLATVMDLVDNELSEPYSIFTYR